MYRTLCLGMEGHDVCILQATLNSSSSQSAPLTIDGIFWSRTMARVKDFQRENQLDVDGIVGPITWGKLLEDGAAPGPDSLLCDVFCDNGNAQHLNSTELTALTQAVSSNSASSLVGSSAGSSVLGFSLPKLPSLPKVTLPKFRPLVGSPEEPIATSVYGSGIDHATVFFSDKTGIGGRAFTVSVPATLLTPARQVMNVGPAPSHDTVQHELAHVWQAQHATDPTLYMSNSIESQGLAEAANFAFKKKTFSAYGYRPGKKFSEYAAEQIAEQAENNETAILSHMRSIAPGKVDPDNDLSLGTPRIEDTSAPGVKI